MEKKQHTISVLVENKFGVLARVAGLFSGRGYNIESLSVNSTNDPAVSKMTIVTVGDDAIIEQIDKQLNKLVDVIKVIDLTGSEFIERELMLIKVKASGRNRAEVIQITEIFQGKIVTVHKNELGIELSGSAQKIEDFINMMKDFGVIELARTGRVAIARNPGDSANYSKK
ncbi:MAG TPA: acetolactate synthase small subunit [Lentisphaeria bacterium]|nr:MAG: acetolactate synthase small subunit [Lentisphaerae bacterium GWF2_49_21]HBC86146.1 acetolactate synthase small subunit [Lentisphaeria bacterium]